MFSIILPVEVQVQKQAAGFPMIANHNLGATRKFFFTHGLTKVLSSVLGTALDLPQCQERPSGMVHHAGGPC